MAYYFTLSLYKNTNWLQFPNCSKQVQITIYRFCSFQVLPSKNSFNIRSRSSGVYRMYFPGFFPFSIIGLSRKKTDSHRFHWIFNKKNTKQTNNCYWNQVREMRTHAQNVWGMICKQAIELRQQPASKTLAARCQELSTEIALDEAPQIGHWRSWNDLLPLLSKGHYHFHRN